MNQLILLHTPEGVEIAVSVNAIQSCVRVDETVTYIYTPKTYTATWIVSETPAEIVAKQWGGVCSA